jgi:hypothetical protein
MSLSSTFLLRAGVLALVAAVSFAGAAPALAGCLTEYGECGTCAKRTLRTALWELDPWGVMDAYVEAADCDIDLLHCLAYDSHHEYSCGS